MVSNRPFVLRLAALQEPENAAMYLTGSNASSPMFAKLNFSIIKDLAGEGTLKTGFQVFFVEAFQRLTTVGLP